jgi:hypothetical protein
MAETLRTLVYGSCVARDVLRVVPEPFSLNGYIARQCWVSAFSSPVQIPDISALTSRFQIRALEGDFRSNAVEQINQHAPRTDLMLIDLASDRHGAVALDGGHVSLTPEHRRAFGGVVKGGKRVPFGSDAHYGMFRRAATGAKNAFEAAGLWDKTFVLRFLFTEHTSSGGTVPRERTTPAEDNAHFARYYDALADLGFQFSDLPDRLAVSTDDHVWGAGSDHFIDEAYLWWANDVTSRVTRE